MSRTIYIVCVCVQFVGAVAYRSEVSWGSTVNLPCLLWFRSFFGYADGSDDLHGFVNLRMVNCEELPSRLSHLKLRQADILLLQELVRAQRLALITTVSANTTREVVAMAIPCSSCCFYMFLLRRDRRRAKTEASPSPAFQRISSTPATFRGRIYKVRAAQVPVNWFWHVLACFGISFRWESFLLLSSLCFLPRISFTHLDRSWIIRRGNYPKLPQFKVMN